MDMVVPSPRRMGTPFRPYSAQPLSPTSDYMTQSTSSTLSLPNPCTMLLERWQHMLSLLTNSTLSSSAIIALNRALDQAEHVVKGAPTVAEAHQSSTIGLGILKAEEHESRTKGDTPATPPHSIKGSPSEGAIEEKASPRKLGNDDELLKRVTSATDALRRQQERFKHFHKAVVSEVEEKTSQVEQLQTSIIQLEKDAADDMTELTYLRFTVRMLEVQTLPFVPKHERDPVAERIEHWKLDWVGSDRRFRTRRRRRKSDRRKYNDLGRSVLAGRGEESLCKGRQRALSDD